MFVPPRYTKEQACEAIAASLSYSQALRRLGMCHTGGARIVLRKYVELWTISTAHFDPHAVQRAAIKHEAVPLANVLVEQSTYSRNHLKRRLLAEGLKQSECELCGQGEVWHGRRMALVLDHINGVADDNRLENLRIVCPNCNATLDTHCARKNRVLPAVAACVRCGKEFCPRHAKHSYCSRECGQRHDRTGRPNPGARRVERPPHAQLVSHVATLGWSATGRKYGVSDNAIRKWVRAYEAADAA